MTDVHACWAVVPVKEVAHAKSRLGAALPADARVALARAMLEDVLRTLADVRELAGIVVVTVDPYAAQLAQSLRAEIFTNGARDGHTGAVMRAAERLERRGCRSMLTVPADIPGVTPAEIGRVLRAGTTGPSFTICPSHDRRGSNAVMISPPCAVPLAFGNDSFLPHLAAARRLGIEPTVVDGVPGIARDVDTLEDLYVVQAAPGAATTKAMLRRLTTSGSVRAAHRTGHDHGYQPRTDGAIG
jgi:2-phospho-L-lactate guanylyltransferase